MAAALIFPRWSGLGKYGDLLPNYTDERRGGKMAAALVFPPLGNRGAANGLDGALHGLGGAVLGREGLNMGWVGL